MSVSVLLLAAAGGVSFAAVGAAAAVRRGETVGDANVRVALMVTGLSTVLGGSVVLVAPGLGVFAVAHYGYLAIVVSLPLVGVGLGALALRRGAANRSVGVVAVVSLVPGALGLYATHVEPYWLRTDRPEVAVPVERAGDDTITVGVLADLQTAEVGDHERRAVRELMAAGPDLILLPGDLFQGEVTDHAREEVGELLAELEAPGGVFFVRGDVDGPEGGRGDQVIAGLENITTLADEVAEVEVGDRTVRIGGTALAFDGPAAREVKDDLVAEPDDGAITILLSHRPDTVLGLPRDSGVDLTVAGHTHGGQIVAPLIGPLTVLSQVPRDVGRGGLSTVDGNRIYVSPGVGMERDQAPQVRFLSRPAIGIVTLHDA